jgi:transposase
VKRPRMAFPYIVRKKVKKATGAIDRLTHRSGAMDRELGISKAGNSWLRGMMVEIAWVWLHWQPTSVLSQWYQKRFGGGTKRQRKIGIVALARKLLIALWRWVEFDVWPEEAIAVSWQQKVGLKTT